MPPDVTRDLACRLAAYIPITLARRILNDNLPPTGVPRPLLAATLFSDISGFTAMSEELASDGPRGAEELNRVLLLTFTGMIDIIHEMGGAVSHFHGDAMSVYFPDENGDAARRALACAQMMQQLMLSSFSRIVTNRPPGKQPFFDLTMKIGVGYGRCREIVVGHSDGSMEFVLAGTAVDEAAAAEQRAAAREVVASRAVLTQAGRPAPAPFHRVQTTPDPPPAHPLLDWDTCPEESYARMVTAVTPFIPPTIFERATTGLTELAEHRPVTSFFVQFDLAAGDEAGHDERLQQYYTWANQVVHRFGGQNARLNRVLTGDKGNQLHVIFGAPMAPDAPDQAVRCALALQQERPSYVHRQRIGLAAGKVFACPVGAEKRREYTVVGDIVNLSARLTQECADGDVLLDEVTARRIRDLVAFEQLPPVSLKGKQGKVTLYRPKEDRIATGQLQLFINRGQRPLVGRKQEMDLLLSGMDAALQDEGHMVAIYGPTGVGKTSLLAAGVNHWLDAGGAILIGEGQQHTADIPYGPWRAIWHDLFGLKSDMDARTQATAVVHHTLSLVPDAGDDVGLWAEVLGLPIPQAAQLADLAAEVRQARFLTLARRCLQATAAERPLLLILEGLHWADQSTLDLIDEISNHLAGHSIFLALTFRPQTQLELKAFALPICTPILLSDLPPQHARQLLTQLVGTAELPPAVEQHLGLRSREGLSSPVNPLFLEEAVNVMMGLGVLEKNGRLQVNETRLHQMPIPDTIHGLLLARIDRLPVASRDLLQVASVIGRQFALDPLLSITTPDNSRELVLELLSRLSAEEITQLVTADPEWTYLFQHAMTHEVAYESLPFARRQALHAAVADWLAERHQDNLKPFYAVLAFHYSRARKHEEGLRFALAAADNARDIFANREAVELYTLAEEHLQALGEEERWETAVHIHLARGEVLILIGDLAETLAAAEKALALAQKHNATTAIARAYNLLAETRHRQGRYDEAQSFARQVIDELASDIPPDQLARAYTWAGWAASSQQAFDAALDHLRHAEQICTQTNNNFRLARVLEAMSYIYYSQRQLEPALEAMERSVQLSRDFSTPINIGISLSNVAFVQFTAGQAEKALATFNEAVAIGRDVGRNLLVLALGNRAAVFAYLGRFKAALADFEEAIALLQHMDYPSLLMETYLFWGYDYSSALGRWEDARYRFAQARQIIDQRPESYPEEQVRLYIGLGQIELETGSLDQALTWLRQAEALIAEKGLNWWRPAVTYYRGRTEQAMGKTAVARDSFRRGLQAIDDAGSPDYRPLLLLSLAELADNEEQKYAYLEQCVTAVNQRSRFTDRLHCLQQAGKMLLAADGQKWRDLGAQALAQARALQTNQSLT